MIGVGVIGCGMISRRRYLPEIAADPGAAVRAVTDVNGERSREVASQYGAVDEPDWQSLLARADIDAVVVAVPNHLHFAIARAALRAGKHLLLEKPMAESLEQADELLALAARDSLTLMMALNQRFMPLHRAVKAALAAGTIGQVKTFSVVYGHSGPESWSPPASWFYNREQAFAGALLDLGIHKIDLLLWLLESPVAQVSAFAGTLEKQKSQVEDNAACLLRFANGVFGTLTASWTYKVREQNDLILYGERGTIRVTGTGSPPAVVLLEQPVRGELILDVPGIETNATAGNSDSGVIREFLTSIRTGSLPSASGIVGRESLEAVIALLTAAREQRVVTLPLPPGAALTGRETAKGEA